MLIAGRNTYICYHNPVYIVIVVWMHGYAIMWSKLFIVYLDNCR